LNNFNWVIYQTLAIGTSPKDNKDLIKLKESGIKSVFCLCNEIECPILNYEDSGIFFKRLVLPDHKSKSQLSIELLENAFKNLKNLIQKKSPVFIHCYAAVERSPLLCLTYLIKEKDMHFDDALAYLMQVHKGTNPMNSQLKILKEYISI